MHRDLSLDACARWLARHHGLTVGATAPRFVRTETGGGVFWFLGSIILADDGPLTRYPDGSLIPGRLIVPGISALTDPADLALACLAAGRSA